MKTKFRFPVFAYATVVLVCAADPTTPPAVSEPCCEPLAAGKPVTARSLYQSDAIWIDDSARSIRLSIFRDRPVVAAMFFTSCEYACPMIVADMQRLRELLPAGVRAKTRFVLLSFDPARDTPSALAAYRERMTLDDGWTLLRGDEATVQELAMLLGIKFKRDARGQFAHSNVITILNTEGEIAHQHAGLQGDVSVAARVIAIGGK